MENIDNSLWNLDRHAGKAGWRRFFLLVLVAVTTAAGLQLLAMALGPQVPYGLAIALLAVFTLSFGWIALSFWTAIVGFILKSFGLHPLSLRRRGPGDGASDGTVPALRGRTAILVPVYNEAPDEVFARLETTWHSLETTGQSKAFELFVLSDTTNDAIAAEEEAGVEALRERLGLGERLHWRRRHRNVGRKAGNIADWLDTHGARFDHMIVFDADSVMSGDTMVRLAALMEASPRTGIIQTHAVAMGRETLFARILQFSSRVYGSMVATGHSFWNMGEANYYGHNAIIRVAAFSEHCRLPVLKGRAPFGGEILSHDFVEAAFIRRAGFHVWNLPNLGGSFEELPTNVVDYAVRDRRWMQGNLQHARLVFMRGLHWMSRLHLVMGIMGYLASPLWLGSLLLSAAIVLEHEIVGPVYFGNAPSLFPNWPQYNTGHVHALLLVTTLLLFLPKLLALVLSLRAPAPAYGGRLALTASVVLETLFSALLAPVMMLFHSLFMLGILAGRAVGWPPQARGERGMPWALALGRHGGQVALGTAAVVVMGYWAPAFLYWLLPVVAGLVLAPLLAVYSSRRDLGIAARRWRMFMTPEEKPDERVSQAPASTT